MDVEKKFKMTPEEYQKILKGVEIQTISLTELTYSCSKEEILKNPVILRLKSNAILKKQENEIAKVIFKFALAGSIAKKLALKINGEYLVEFSTKDDFTEDFLEVFKEYSLRLLMTPYMRDLFYTISMRSNLPGIILPLIKFFPTEKKLA